jgi:hypothetical protein
MPENFAGRYSMKLHDIAGNLHLHTTASDGTGTHKEVAAAAAKAGLDFIIYTDHNIWTDGAEGWFIDPKTGRNILCLMGQEINDPCLKPEANHLLCHFVTTDLSHVAHNPQTLINAAHQAGGLTFLAHPLERPGYGQAAITFPWINWEVDGFTGIELWNAMTDVKWQLRTVPRGLLGAYVRQWVLNSPFDEVLAKWDELLATGRKVVAIGNSDAHSWPVSLGPLTRTMYPYEFLFRAVNTHLLLTEPLAADFTQAGSQIYRALQAGHCYLSNDLIASPRGFNFTGCSGPHTAIMGDTLPWQGQAHLRVVAPRQATLRLIKDGQSVAETRAIEVTWRITEPGVYRVEAYRWFWGWSRGWVYTNPIYVR